MDFSNYKVRCHTLGVFITEKTNKVSNNDTVRKKIQEFFIFEKDNARKTIYSPYFENGIANEPSGLQLLNDTIYNDGKTFVPKKKIRNENEYLTGETDCIIDDYITDVKNAYDRYTFGRASLTNEYKWQGKGYMWINNIPNFRLFYCINNMPDYLVEKELKKEFYGNRNQFLDWDNRLFDKDWLKIETEIRSFYNYDEMPLWERFKTWDVHLEDGDVELMKEVVLTVRSIMQTLWADHEENCNRNRRLMGV